MGRGRGFTRRDGSIVRRQTEWLATEVQTDFSALAANTIQLDAVLSVPEKAFRPFTIVRTLGLLYVISDQNSADEQPFGGIGGIVVQDQAVSIGVTAIPDPENDAASDSWFLHQFWAAPIIVGDGTGFSGSPGQQYLFDSRAMRKVNNEEDIAFMITNASGAAGIEFLWKIRMLIKLH